MLISVIVPVYNTKEYLSFCLESILNQTYKNIEVIVVDDGSEDGSLEICMEYADRDSRVTVIKNAHQGVVLARRSGADKAKGEYCIFVDSDDWIAENLIESVLALTDEGSADIVNFNIRTVEGSKETEWLYTVPEGVYGPQDMEGVYGRMMFDFENGRPGIIQSLCSKLIKTKILRASMEAVDGRITMGEDAAIVYKAMLLAKKAAVTNRCFYFYRVHSGSMYHSKDENIFFEMSCFQKYMQSIFSDYSKKYKLDEQLKFYLMSFIRKGVEDLYGLKLRELYRIPFRTSDLKGKFILYGAGSVGKSYYRQLIQIDSVKLVSWMDQGLAGRQIYGREIESPTVLSYAEFDMVLIAVKDGKIAEEIRKQLSVQIPDKKILWGAPKINWWERELDI